MEGTKKEDAKLEESELQRMIEAGVHYGHKPSKTHPKMKEFCAGVRNNVEIINLEKTLSQLEEALGFIKELIVKNKVILFVGTTPPARDSVKEIARKFGFPYVVGRWIGGFLTNFKTISGRIDYFKDLRQKKESGELEKYTKKERLEFDREIARLEEMFSGVENIENPPDAIFVVNVVEHSTAVREAKRLKIPIIAIVDTDADPHPIDYLIPANDNAKASIAYILNKVGEAIEEARKSKS